MATGHGPDESLPHDHQQQHQHRHLLLGREDIQVNPDLGGHEERITTSTGKAQWVF